MNWLSGTLKLLNFEILTPVATRDPCEPHALGWGQLPTLFGDKRKHSLRRVGIRGNVISSDPELLHLLTMCAGDMSMKDVTEVGEECGPLSGPRTQRRVCAHVGTPSPGLDQLLPFPPSPSQYNYRDTACPSTPTPGEPGNGISAHWVPAEPSQ